MAVNFLDLSWMHEQNKYNMNANEEEEDAFSEKENNADTSLKELDSEVRRMNARADQLMDSFAVWPTRMNNNNNHPQTRTTIFGGCGARVGAVAV